jgi:superfamily I DNA/RNA helicase
VSEEVVDAVSLFRHVKGIGEAAITRIERELPLQCPDFWDRLFDLAISPKAKEKLKEIQAALADFVKKADAKGVRPALEEAAAFLDMDIKQPTVERLLELAGAFGKNLDGLALHLEQNKKETVYDQSAEAVTLMTFHAAKGIEFPVVFLTGLEQGLMPCHMDRKTCDLEEERRLFYVGLTRAKETLLLTASSTRQIHGTTYNQNVSQFVAEIPSHLVKKEQKRIRKNVKKSQLKLF